MLSQEMVDVDRARNDARKKKIRGGHKAHLLKLKGDISKIVEAYREECEEELLAIKACLERKALVISKLDTEIMEELDDENEIVKEIEESEEFQKEIRREILKIEKFMRVKNEEETRSNPGTSDEIHRNNVSMSLPKLEIPKFSGDPKSIEVLLNVLMQL